MTGKTDKFAIKVIVALLLVLALASGFCLFSRVEVERFSAQPGDYTVVVSKRRYESFMMRAPGDGRGAPGFIELFDNEGKSCGRIPVPMISCRDDLRWSSAGAEIPLVGEWDFRRRTCYYWSGDQDRQIWVRR